MPDDDPEHSSVSIAVGRFDRVYRPGSTVEGHVLVVAKGGWSHSGLRLNVTGQVELARTPSTQGVLPPSALHPEIVFSKRVDVRPPGTIAVGTTEIPFSFTLEPQGRELFETYHGEYISITYTIGLTVERGSFARALSDTHEFVVEGLPGPAADAEPIDFQISPSAAGGAGTRVQAQDFLVTGKLHRTQCPINAPFTGEIRVERSDARVNSVHLQLVRKETVVDEGGAEGSEESEIQDMQVAIDDVAQGMILPLYMIFPRLYACPSMATRRFCVAFEARLVIRFHNGSTAVERFPVRLLRTRP